MRSEVWEPLYARICQDFGFDPSKDSESASILAQLLGPRSDRSLERVRSGFPTEVLVCGGAPVLADHLSAMDVSLPVVAADSATTVVLEAGVRPDFIVTDLDGVVEDQIEVNSACVPVFVHAHGDNMPALRRHVARFPGPIVGTCQCRPPEHVFNFGGFTDGDRAACICAEMGAREISLIGFDFENPSEKHGRSRDVKRRKLAWARRILDELKREGVRITFPRP